MDCFRTSFILLAILFITNNSIAQNVLLDCSKMSENEQYTNPDELDLTFNGEIENFEQLNVRRIISTSNVKNNNNLRKTYIDAALIDDGYISVFTTDDFPTYAHEETDTIIRLKVEYECMNAVNKFWYFYQIIKPGNYFAPVFSQNDYNFIVPLPLYRGLNIATFLTISAHDDDLVNNTISFSSPDAENYMIQVGTSNVVGEDKKTYNAILQLMKILLSITEQIEFTIIATDSGSPPRSTNATVTIIRDIENSLPPQPQFTKFIYDGQLDADLNLAAMEPIILHESTFSDLVTFQTSGDDAELFQIEPILNEINLQLSRKLTDDDIIGKTYFKFNIIASNSQLNETGNSGVVIGIPVTNQESNTNFEQTLYIGQINDSQLEIEKIHLNTLFDEQIDFSLQNPDSIYFDMLIFENIVQLTLKPDIDDNQWANKSFLSITIKASIETKIIATTEVIIEIQKSTHNINFKFKQLLYIGKVEMNEQIELETIIIESDDSTVLNRLTISLEGNDSDLFKFEYVNNEVLLSLKDGVNEESWEGKSMLSMSIIATDSIDSTVAATGVILEILNNSSKHSFQFDKTLYTGEINGLILNLENVQIHTAINDSINFSLQNSDAGFFNMIITENVLQLNLKSDIDENQWANKSFLSVQVVANFGDKILATTEVIIEIQKNQQSLNFKFEKILYVGKFEMSAQIELETIIIESVDSSVLNRLSINLEGYDSGLFKYEYVSNEVKLSFKDDVSEESWKGKSILSLRIIATDPIDSTIAATGVIIQIISNESTTPCPMPEPCPTTAPPTDIPVFEKDLYLFSEKPNYIGTIGTVTARIPNTNELITYKILVTNDHLISRILIHEITGEITLTSIVSPGIYVFQAIAINNAEKSQGTSTVRLEIDSIVQCGNQTFVANSLIIKRLEEMKIHNEVMKTTYENCAFEIFDEYPKTETNFFSIDQTTNMITSNIFNREDPIFASMIVPQIQLKLKLKCPEIVTNEINNGLIMERYRRDANENNEIVVINKSLVLTDDIPFKIDETLLTIIIIDINDNYPQFINPSENNLIIGYPDKEISSDLLPEYLIKIQAFDIDEGINASIFYTIKNNGHFTIDPLTGIIYPFKNAMNSLDTLTLEIDATDRNGSSDGLTNTTTIIVKKLLSNEIILLTFEVNKLHENIDYLLLDIENRVHLKLIPIKHAIVPNDNNEQFFNIIIRMFKQNEQNDEFILKVWAYAFDENDKPIETSDIKKQLTQIEEELKFSVESYEDARKSEIVFDKINTTGYVIAVSLLSIISFVCIGFIVWWFYVKNHKFIKPISGTSTTIGTPFMAKLQTDIEYKKSIGDGTDYGPELSHYQKRESVKIFGITSNETSDENQQKKLPKQLSLSEQSRTSDSANESSSVKSDNNSIDDDKPNKSTVTFNEMVERIDIESEDETQPNNWEAISKF